MPLIASVSGIRGTVKDALGPEIIAKYVTAFSEMMGNGPIIIGRDGRPSGKAILDQTIDVLTSLGRDVIEIGVVPTPTVQMEILRHSAAGGISISASHNPAEWNGLKFLDRTSLFLAPELAGELIQQANNETSSQYASTESVGNIKHELGAIAEHVKRVLELRLIDVPIIRSRKFRVVVDAENAGGSVAIPAMLEALGCDVVRLYCDGSGNFPHTPEPLPENLGDLCRAVLSEKADLGVAVDPDSDRLVLITDQGIPFGEEYTIVACVQTVLQKNPGTPVVINLSTTRAVADVANAFGSTTYRTPVGEINVANKMRDCGALIGGEGSGGVILAPLHLGRDALVGCALILQNLAANNISSTALRASLPSFFMRKHRIALTSQSEATTLLDSIAKRFAAEELRTDDGVHVAISNGDWIHARVSNTEPIVRVITEARTAAEAEELVRRATTA